MAKSLKETFAPKLIAVEKAILREIGSSRFLLTINGVIRKHNNDPVFVRSEKDEIMFYTMTRVGDKRIRAEVSPTVRDSILLECCSSELFGKSFLEWTTSRYESTGQWLFNVKANSALKVLYFETDMYYRFRKDVLKEGAVRNGLNINQDGGIPLSSGEFLDLVGKVRVNGFKSVLELSRVRFMRAINKNTRMLYRFDNIYFPGMIRDPDLFNPFFDDKLIVDTLKDRQIYKLIIENNTSIRYANLDVSYLTHLQVCKALNLPKMVPFNFEILFGLLAGMVLEPRVAGYDFPNKTMPLFRLARENEFYEREFLTIEQYQEASENERGFYVRSTTFNYHFVRNMPFFRRAGYANMSDLLDVVDNTILL